MVELEGKRILDACCGGRRFWFNQKHPDTLYMDIRKEIGEIYGKKINVDPDVIGDFRDMPFPNESFYMVVFDPPHLKWAGQNSIMRKQYGQLDKETWQEDLKKGFSECFRVLKQNGTMIFKWSDCQIPLKDVLALTEVEALFGQRRVLKNNATHWLVFMKLD